MLSYIQIENIKELKDEFINADWADEFDDFLQEKFPFALMVKKVNEITTKEVLKYSINKKEHSAFDYIIVT